MKDEKAALSQLRQFVTLWNQIEKSNLSYSLPVTKKHPVPIFKQDKNPYYKAIQIAWQYADKEIVSFPELFDFINNNFITVEEARANQEIEDRKEALRLTRQLAYFSISISVVIAIITCIFNYLTYTNDRNVIIKNPHAFSDTTKVVMITDGTIVQQRIDSSKYFKKVH
ncbi:MAG TPA: hypothetical protein VMU30_07690 [Bacteroidota bacterium]|nr:hypothetical protein [Bacteroidota bacterium]